MEKEFKLPQNSVPPATHSWKLKFVAQLSDEAQKGNPRGPANELAKYVRTSGLGLLSLVGKLMCIYPD
jgi:hypothetical protein